AAGLNTTTGANVIATPTTNTTYTVSVINSEGCTGTATIQITVNPDHCCLASNYTFSSSFNTSGTPPFTSGSVSNLIFDIGPGVVITVNNTLILSNCVFRFGAGAGMVIASPVTLSIINNSHLYSCMDTWNGIKLNPGSALNFNSNSWLEDAQIGIESVGGAVYTINTGIFNHNFINIQVDPSGPHNGTIKNSALTCRQIPIFPAPTIPLPFNTLPITNLPSPNSSLRTYVGMLINGVQSIQVGSPAKGGMNYFDNMDYGVWFKMSGATIQNNQFQNISGKIHFSVAGGYYTGIAIYGQQTKTGSPLDVTIGGSTVGDPNIVTECYRGIDLSGDFRNITVLNNFENVSATNGPGIFSGTQVGLMGIYINPGSTKNITVSNNNVTNFITGIMQVRGSTSSNAIVTYNANNISATALPGYCNYGMWFQDPSNVVATTSLTISNNVTANVYTGINCTNLKGNAIPYTCYYNKFGMRYKTLTSFDQIGMLFSGCKAIQVHNNHVICDPAAAAAGGKLNVAGIYLQNSPTMYVHCNLVE
ncbi:MAG TPA: hypothetical protein VNZ45_00285, partial [Bacteroidia bacterium]|nr:hypothetical protein [Bacteroidia bacterium]